MKIVLLAAAAVVALPALAQDVSDHVCVRQVRKFAAFRFDVMIDSRTNTALAAGRD